MNKRLLATLILLAGCIWNPFCGYADNHWEETFITSNQAYREDRFQEAIDGYLELIRSGHGTGTAYYNLGNAYFRSNQIGRAIWAYERALLQAPRDADLRFNLSRARDQTQDVMTETRGSLEAVFFWLKSFSIQELYVCFSLLNLLLWSVLALRLFNRSEWVYYFILVTLSCWFVAGLSFGLKYYQMCTDDRAVILEKEVHILAGPETDDTVLFKVHEGTMVHQERAEGGWRLVRLSDDKRGWVPAASVRSILDENYP